MINLPYEKCYGCQGCRNICPKDAISMKEDQCGYKYPVVDYNKCIKCGLCVKVCPELNSYTLNSPIQVLAVVAKDEKTVQTTASGGVATLLSKEILDNGGVVYGCSENSFESIGHIRVSNEKDLSKIKNSKYVHSDIRLTYREAKKDLEEGKTVLFTGTPCQISGLLGFLRKPYDNLITMDLVCHGVPPMKMLKDQVLSYQEIKNVPREDIFVKFRWKTYSRSGCPKGIHYGLRTEVRSGKTMKVVREENDRINAYMRCFQTGISLRENCLQCPYARKERIADLTAADFWGIGRVVKSELLDLTGVSLILINTEKGRKLFKKIKENVIIEEHSLEEASLNNQCLRAPFERLKERDDFLSIYQKEGLFEAAKKTDPTYNFEKIKLIQIARNYKISNFMVRALAKILRIIHILH